MLCVPDGSLITHHSYDRLLHLGLRPRTCCRHPCKFVKRKHTSPDARFLRSAQYRCRGTTSSHMCLSAVVPAVAEPDIHSLYRARRPSQKIEFVFSASPETIRGSIGRLLSFAQSATCGTWRPARCINS